MKNFNPDKELNKIKYRKRNKIILLCFLMIVASIISYSFALYQVRHSKRIIYTTVSDFSNTKDLELAVYLNGEKHNGPLPQNGGYRFLDMICDVPYSGVVNWNDEKALLSVPPLTIPNKCNVYLINDVYDTFQEFNNADNAQEYIVPSTGTYKIELWGAAGGGASNIGGKGAYTRGYIDLEVGDTLYFYVGSKGIGGLTTQPYLGGYNGGGSITSVYKGTYSAADYNWNSYSGGGATDVRLKDGTWDNFESLKSRIMVAAGGGGGAENLTSSMHGGSAGGLEGYDGDLFSGANMIYSYGVGAKQNTGGRSIYANDGNESLGYFGKGGNIQYAIVNGVGGGGYYGGGASYEGTAGINKLSGGGGGGGSSFISGHPGCNAIDGDKSTSLTQIVHTGNPEHYSGKVFTETVMIDGEGYSWTSEKQPGIVGMPTFDGTKTMIGNTDNGHAKITKIK